MSDALMDAWADLFDAISSAAPQRLAEIGLPVVPVAEPKPKPRFTGPVPMAAKQRKRLKRSPRSKVAKDL